jgi:hypothetical protein
MFCVVVALRGAAARRRCVLRLGALVLPLLRVLCMWCTLSQHNLGFLIANVLSISFFDEQHYC